MLNMLKSASVDTFTSFVVCSVQPDLMICPYCRNVLLVRLPKFIYFSVESVYAQFAITM